MQASRLSQLDKRFVLCGASALAPRPTVCRQAWLRKQVAAAQQSVPPPASFVCVVQAQGRFTAEAVVDHIIPHRGDPHLMWDESNWQALCKPCPTARHGRKTEILSIGIDCV